MAICQQNLHRMRPISISIIQESVCTDGILYYRTEGLFEIVAKGYKSSILENVLCREKSQDGIGLKVMDSS